MPIRMTSKPTFRRIRIGWWRMAPPGRPPELIQRGRPIRRRELECLDVEAELSLLKFAIEDSSFFVIAC